MGSSPLTRKYHEEHNDTYHDLPSTFLLDEFAFKSHSQAQNGPLLKFRVNITIRWEGLCDHLRRKKILTFDLLSLLHLNSNSKT